MNSLLESVHSVARLSNLAIVEDVFLEELSSINARAWDRYVDSHPDATVYHLRAWQQAASRAYGLATPFLLARHAAAGEVCGVLPLFVVENPLGGYLTTGIFGAYGHVIADSRVAKLRLLDGALEIARHKHLGYFVHKSVGEEAMPADFRRHDPCVTAVLPLTAPDTMFRGFRSEIRNRIRKAERSGLELRCGVGQLPAFYEVLATNMHRKGTPAYGLEFMSELVAALEDRAEVLTLWKDGLAVSGALLVYSNDSVLVPFVSSRASSFSLCPNNLIYWEVIQRAWARGMRQLDFGRSFRNSSNLDFKLRWGARTVAQPIYVYSSGGGQPKLDSSDRSVRRLVALWKKVPLPIANALGPSLCRRFLV